ncbi:hypothetical protein CTAYLR_000574, partial [Chrysophaeum taylorii]
HITSHHITLSEPPGQYSSDGLEHGNTRAYKDANNRTIDENDPSCVVGVTSSLNEAACSDSCVPCPSGRYNEFSLDRYSRLGEGSCNECPVGRFLEDNGLDASLHDDESDCQLCPPGKFGNAVGEDECTTCSVGTFAADSGNLFCASAEPGFHVNTSGASAEIPCARGTFSVGGASECTECEIGSFNSEIGNSACRIDARVERAKFKIRSLSEHYDNKTHSVTDVRCVRGVDELHTSTSRTAALQASYYWDSVRYAAYEQQEAQCTECCVQCDSACPDDDDACHECEDRRGVITLESYPVQRGYWRATPLSTKVYECELRGACRGGNDTKTSAQCARGHYGALCGACRAHFDYSQLRNKCVKCGGPAINMVGSAGTLIIVLLIFVTIVSRFLMRRFGLHGTCWRVFEEILTGRFEFIEAVSSWEQQQQQQQSADSERKQRERFRSIMTKLKIVIACWQISSSTVWTLPRVRFPVLFEVVLKTGRALGLDFIELGSFNCALQLSYFSKLCVASLLPFAFALVICCAYAADLARSRVWRRRDDFEERKERAASMATYLLLLIFYVALPSCSSYTFRYFSCLNFDRGRGRDNLRVLAVSMDIRCTSPAYRGWLWFVVLMVIVWPIGVPLSIAVLLWSNRHRLDPPLEGDSRRLFRRDRRQLVAAADQRKKIEVRDKDHELRRIEFIFEEYQPRVWAFPVFELVRRVFLSAVLAMFYPGSTSQVAVGALGAFVSHRVFLHYQPYISDEDNLVSELAQTQLVIIYFAALVVYASNETRQKEGVFASNTFGALLVIVYFSSFALAVWIVLLQLYGVEETPSGGGERLDPARENVVDMDFEEAKN